MKGLRLVAADAFQYRLPLVTPLTMPSGTYTEREGVLLRLTAEDGTEGWGDAAPLPGYSPDTLDDVLAELPMHLRMVRERDARLDGLTLSFEGEIRRPAGRGALPVPPSLLWAVEQAVTDLSAQHLGWSLPRVYAWAERPVAQRDTPTAATVSLNALLPGDDPVPTAERLAREGWSAAKLKVGRRTPEADAALVRDVARALGDVALRLDANRAWSMDDAVAFAQAIHGTPIAYIEEPLADWRRQPDLAQRTGFPFALDESLRELSNRRSRLVTEATAFVVKPMVTVADPAFLRRQAGRHTPVVMSSTFESGVGMRHLVARAAVYGDTPAGLDTYRWLADDVLSRRLPIAGPTVDVAEVLAENPVRIDALTPLDL